jgi:hypothetical protein
MFLSTPLQDEVGADEPGASGNDNRFFHERWPAGRYRLQRRFSL